MVVGRVGQCRGLRAGKDVTPPVTQGTPSQWPETQPLAHNPLSALLNVMHLNNMINEQ